MTNLSAVLGQLKKERDQLDQAIKALSGLVSGGSGARTTGTQGVRRTLSAAARQRIAEAQRARWAKIKSRAGKKAA